MRLIYCSILDLSEMQRYLSVIVMLGGEGVEGYDVWHFEA